MLGKSLLLFTSDRAGTRPLAVALRASGTEVIQVDTPRTACELIAARAVDLVLFDYTEAYALVDLAFAALGRVPFAVMVEEGDPDVLREVVCDLGIPHLMVRPEPREVVVTAEKILRGDLFGINKYLPAFGADLSTYEVSRAGDREELIEIVTEHLGWLGAGRTLRTQVQLVIDELVTNAVYNAPRDPDGTPRYASLDRREKIELLPWERAHVAFGSDGERFVFAVTDWFGGLTTDRIRDRLKACLTRRDQIETKAGGAGLGLYAVQQSVDQLVINVEPDVRTEVIAVATLPRRGTTGARPGRSLHLFQKAATNVEVSPALRSEIVDALAPRRRARRVVALTQPKAA